LKNLEEVIRDKELKGISGIGHTRWATHGKPSKENAHPHCSNRTAIVHNGIVENYRELKSDLESQGRLFFSETDTEVLAHLIDIELEKGFSLLESVIAVTQSLNGSYALAAIEERTPGNIVVAKNGGSPLVLGLSEREVFLASDVPAILPFTRQMLFMEDGEFAVLNEDGVKLVDVSGEAILREPEDLEWNPMSINKERYETFMQKEIFEQPNAIRETIGTRISDDGKGIDLDEIEISPEWLSDVKKIIIIACGTAYYAGLIGKYFIESLARIPVEVDLASEFRYRDPIISKNDLVILVSQSGETADTIAALREARARGARLLSICNVRDSTVVRGSDDVLFTQAGPEIGVASTKAFTTQLVNLQLIALKLGLISGALQTDEVEIEIKYLKSLPAAVEKVLSLDGAIREIAQRFYQSPSFLFLGRGVMYPIALEGALKLKEISYIHAEGFAAGEMKHGPIALIDEQMPIVVIVNKGRNYDKTVSNVEEVRARGGKIFAVASESDETIALLVDEIVKIPALGEYATAVLSVIPLQLLAYHIARLKGTDVDQPRNLAKSVTVE
ncbi:glutamine--fructose-6-phosphate transaminase (isomerizing), partial [Myxococcota bacterium]|nr:glutamine--fructose-6-phosphate transaminase (isomerizing) [Myxococcota bacterium]